MRRRAMEMTMVTVLVAVGLLGIPLGGVWVVLAMRTTACRWSSWSWPPSWC